MRTIPVIFLAFANDRVDDASYLRNLPKELDGIRRALYQAQEAGLCEIVERSNLTISQLLDIFQDSRYRDRIAVFHYGGHANGYQLLLESLEGQHASAYSDGLVGFLAKQRSLKFIFLNGCSSQQQALDLVRAGVPAVIGTSQSINDDVATQLAIRFYMGLGRGLNMERAWMEAIDEAKIQKGSANMRDLYFEGMEETASPDRFPWDVYYKDGAEIIKEWNLPDEAGNPLFNLPPIPNTHNLPESPFLFLKRYEREHAKVFFGRSYYIRDLYNKITADNSPPIILLYGQSGVGKSSLFDAGVNPRLEQSHTIRYMRRDSLLGLCHALEQALDPSAYAQAHTPELPVTAGEGEDDASPERLQLVNFIESLQAQKAEANPTIQSSIDELIDKLKRELSVMDGGQVQLHAPESIQILPESALGHLTGLLKQWRTIEARTGKPLLIILDQAEELFTRPIASLPNELDDLMRMLDDIFKNPKEFPKGKLVLGYRKEYNPEIEEAFKRYALPRSRMFIETLSKKDIVDIFRGLSETAELRQRYGLSVEKELPYIIADDLLEDKNSPVAPVLQILLTKMWDRALAANASKPQFTIALYQGLKKDGILLDDFFYQQLNKLREWAAEVELSGLALDVLFFHTTRLGTAGSRSLEEIRERYQHRQDVIDSIVLKFKELYLLNDVGANITGLAHDTIAPLIQNEFRYSDRPGQRASRILENKMIEIEADGNTILDLEDLELVEEGQHGMRYWVHKERELVEKSKARRERFMESRKRLKRLTVATVITMMAIGLFGLVQWNSSKKLLKDLAVRNLESLSRAYSENNPTLAMAMAKHYYDLKVAKGNSNNSESKAATDNLKQVLARCLGVPTYKVAYQSIEGIKHFAISPDASMALTVSINNTVQLWDAKGEIQRVITSSLNEIIATDFFAGSNGLSILVSFRDGQTKSFELDGSKIETTSANLEDSVFWTDNNHSRQLVRIPGSADRGAVSYRFIHLKKNQAIDLPQFPEGNLEAFAKIAAFSDDGQFVLLKPYNDDVFALWDTRENQVKTWEVMHEKFTEAIFAHEKHEIIAITNSGFIVWLDLAGELNKVIETKQADLRNLAVSPDHKFVAAYSQSNGTAIIWEYETNEVYRKLQDGTGVKLLGFSGNSRHFYKMNEEGLSVLWDLYAVLPEIDNSGDYWMALFNDPIGKHGAFSMNAEFIVSTNDSDSVELLDWRNNKAYTLPIEQPFAPQRMQMLYSRGYIARLYHLNDSAHLQLFDAQGQEKPLPSIDTLGYTYGAARAMAISPNGKYMALIVGNDVVALNMASDSLWLVPHPFDAIALPLVSLNDQGMLALLPEKDILGIVDISGERSPTSTAIDGHHAWSIDKIAISPGGEHIALASATKITLWDISSGFLEECPAGFDQIQDIRFTDDNKRLLVATTRGIYSWYMLKNLIEKLHLVGIDQYSLQQQVQRSLSQFNGKVVYTFNDIIFYRKIFIFLLIMMIGLRFINELVDIYDKKMYMKLAFYAPAYSMLVLFPILLFEFGENRAELMEQTSASIIFFTPIFVLFAYWNSKEFGAKGKKMWQWVHLGIGTLGFLAAVAFIWVDYLSLYNADLPYVLFAMAFFTAIVAVLMQRSVKAWYEGRKLSFYLYGAAFGFIMFIIYLFTLAVILGV